ncbi:Hpt domain-containing protein [Sphingomonas sp. MMS24-JH45]
MGTAFARLVGYLREDGPASVAAIEDGSRADDAAAMVLPAHTLKGEAAQFGAAPLALLAERIEDYARAGARAARFAATRSRTCSRSARCSTARSRS